MARHMIVAVTRHDDGSQSSRIWGLPAERIDTVADFLGEPDHRSHIPAHAREAERAAVDRVRAASIVVSRDRRP